MISPKYQRLAKTLGLTQGTGQSDKDFIDTINRLRGHRSLIFELKGLGGEVTSNMTSAALRLAICERQLVALAERGFVKNARMFVGVDPVRKVEIREVVLDRSKRHPTVTVKYWILDPWDKENNQGRANHKPADYVLENARLAPS